jgi:5-methylcytosine-specific restriction endonuclease McrA
MEGPFHIDHIVPVSRGGSNRDDNLCVACAPCNLRKSAKVGTEWRQ